MNTHKSLPPKANTMAESTEETVASLERELQTLKEEMTRLVNMRKDESTVDPVVGLTEAIKSLAPQSRPVYISTSRKCDRFRDKPERQSEPTILEWVSDIKAQMESRNIPEQERPAFIIDHLAGKARQEIVGRGEAIRNDAAAIFATLVKVFGDGDTLAQLQQRFFSFRQGDEDLLTCSLQLVELYDRIIAQDPTYAACKDSVLKGRLAEAVREEGLKREMRRLNVEAAELSFFDMRDRAIQWMGRGGRTPKKEVMVRETGVSELYTLLHQQSTQLATQQRQIDQLVSALNKNQQQQRGVRGYGTEWLCYQCNKPGHLRRNCPDLRPPRRNAAAPRYAGGFQRPPTAPPIAQPPAPDTRNQAVTSEHVVQSAQPTAPVSSHSENGQDLC